MSHPPAQHPALPPDRAKVELFDAQASQLQRVILAASIGNFVEWFDFAVYGFLAATITQVFFPGSSATVGLLKIFAVFAVAFAFRPLGGVVFGVLGDRIGRKRTLSLTIIIMACATTLIGLLPSYSAIGAWSALLLTVVRCLQGFSAGGEYAGACAYVMEHAPHDKRAFYGSFVPVATFVSFACAALTTYLLQANLNMEQMLAWGWRIPFLVAAPVGLVGLYLRLNLNETPAFQALMETPEIRAPLAQTLRTQGGPILKLGCFVSLTALSFYFYTTWFATYLHRSGQFSQAEALRITIISLLLSAAACPVLGWLCDRIGRPAGMLASCLITVLGIYPALTLGASGQFSQGLWGMILLSMGAVLANVITAPLLAEVFATPVRYTASAITYNLAYTLFGGTAPFVATGLIAWTGHNGAPAGYLIAIAGLALLGALALNPPFHGPLRQR